MAFHDVCPAVHRDEIASMPVKNVEIVGELYQELSLLAILVFD